MKSFLTKALAISSLFISIGVTLSTASAHSSSEKNIQGKFEVGESCWFKGEPMALLFPIAPYSESPNVQYVLNGNNMTMTGTSIGLAAIDRPFSPSRPDLFAIFPCIPGGECPKNASGDYEHLSDIQHILRVPASSGISCTRHSVDFNDPTKCLVYDHGHVLSAARGEYDVPEDGVTPGDDDPKTMRFNATFDIWGAFYNPSNQPARFPRALTDWVDPEDNTTHAGIVELLASGQLFNPFTGASEPFPFLTNDGSDLVLKLPVMAPLGEDLDKIPASH